MTNSKKYTEFVYIAKKKCRICNEIKSRSFFAKDSYNKFGLQSKCRDCSSLATKLFRKNNPNYFKIKNKERYHSVGKKHNKERYSKYQKDYLKRKKEYLETIRGRLTTLLFSAKQRAVKQLKKYELDIKWLLKKYEKQNGSCLLTNIKFDLTKSLHNKRFFNPFAPSLDKIDPSKGYTKSNTRLVCVMINLALNKFGEDRFKQIAKAYIKTRKAKEIRNGNRP